MAIPIINKYGATAYKAARQDPGNAEWHVSRGNSPDADMTGEYTTIVARCRDLVRNNPVAAAIMGCLQDFVAPTGLTPTHNDKTANEIWGNWAADCHITGTKNWDTCYSDMVGAQTESGEILVYTPQNPNAKGVKTRLDFVEADRITTPKDIKDGAASQAGTVRNGVVYDPNGVEIGYYVAKINPRTSQYETHQTAANFHYFDRYKNDRLNATLLRRPGPMRPGQTRQLPIYTTIVQQIKDVDDFWDASIQRARTLALNGVILESSEPDAVRQAFGQVPNDDDNTYAQDYKDMFGNCYTIGRLLSGSITTVPFGTKPHIMNLSGSMDIEKLIVLSLRLIGAALGFPLELALRDFSRTNFSSGKLAYDGVFRVAERWNSANARRGAHPIYRLILTEAWLNSDALAKDYPVQNIGQFLTLKGWMGGPKTYNADPSKESIAEERRLDNAQTTEEILAAENGRDWEALQESRKRILVKKITLAKELAIEAGISEQQAIELMLRKNDRQEGPKAPAAGLASEPEPEDPENDE